MRPRFRALTHGEAAEVRDLELHALRARVQVRDLEANRNDRRNRSGPLAAPLPLRSGPGLARGTLRLIRRRFEASVQKRLDMLPVVDPVLVLVEPVPFVAVHAATTNIARAIRIKPRSSRVADTMSATAAPSPFVCLQYRRARCDRQRHSQAVPGFGRPVGVVEVMNPTERGYDPPDESRAACLECAGSDSASERPAKRQPPPSEISD